MIQFSEELICAWGFEKFADGVLLEAQFFWAEIFAIEGFVVEDESPVVDLGEFKKERYRIGICSSINSLFRELCATNFIDDEKEWREGHGSSPPFLAVLVGPTKYYEERATFVRYNKDIISAYECFDIARGDLIERKNALLPRIVTSLACRFTVKDRVFRFKPVDQCFYGVSREGRTIKGFRVTGSATGYTSIKMEKPHVAANLSASVKLTTALSKKFSDLYYAALNENNSKFKFLYFFQAIEYEVKFLSSGSSYEENLKALDCAENQILRAARELRDTNREHWRNITSRFIWAAVFVLRHLSDEDVLIFKALKKIRDGISHGSSKPVPYDAVIAVERLATRIQSP